MRTSVQLVGADELGRRLKRLSQESQAKVRRAVQATAAAVHADAVKSIQRGPASGLVYEKYQPRRSHQASAPGQPPQSDTGALASSIAMILRGMRAEVGTSLEYGKHLEFGTSEIKPRPWLVPAVERNRRDFAKAMREAVT